MTGLPSSPTTCRTSSCRRCVRHVMGAQALSKTKAGARSWRRDLELGGALLDSGFANLALYECRQQPTAQRHVKASGTQYQPNHNFLGQRIYRMNPELSDHARTRFALESLATTMPATQLSSTAGCQGIGP